jgi:hypothetical protein
MRGVAGILALTQATDPNRFAAVESMFPDVNRRRRSDESLLVVLVRLEILIAG